MTGVGKYSGEFAEWLSLRGHEVRVICAPPHYPQWKILAGYRRWWYQRERISKVELWRCPLWVPHRPGGLTRLLHLFSFVLSSTPILLRQVFWRPQVILTMEPPFMGAPSVLLAAWLSRARTWLHVQDLEVDAAFALGLLRHGWMSRLAFNLERRIKTLFSGISTISSAMAVRLQSKLATSSLPPVFPNWVDMSAIQPLDSVSDLRKELGIGDDAMVALYAGNMGKKQGLELIVSAAKKLADDRRLVFVFCGDGVAAQGLRAQTEGMENVRWLPLQPFERLNALLNLADIHLLPQRADAADLVMPSKLTGMMASGRPVVATAHSGTEVARAVSEAGRVTPPENAEAFMQAIVELGENPRLRAQLGHAARQYAQAHWEIDAVLSDFEETLVQCVSNAHSCKDKVRTP